ncbi:MAG: DegT/DnrJ/EryC1/StrS aminotransferase family protein [Phycisphaera sp.]|nr:DegT/DnrJ/EryC1/StrS aminotransferase family protein [Phycisphaera sp.]
MDSIPLNRPDIRAREHTAIHAALDGLLRGERESVATLEEVAGRTLGRPFAVAANSASAALEAAFRALGLAPDDEVICSAYAPARLVAAIVRAGLQPCFIDAQPRTAGIDVQRLEENITDRTRAIAIAPTWFDPSLLESLAALSRKYEIPLIEDAVESLGSTIDDEVAGGFGRIAVIGLGPSSPAFAAGGGLMVTNDERLADAARETLRGGRASTDDPGDIGLRGFDHVRRGLDARMDPLRAAVAIGVLERLEETIELRQAIAAKFVARLGGEADLQIPSPASSAGPSWPAFPVRLDERFVADDRDAVIAGLRRHEIVATRGWSLCPALPVVGMTGHGDHDADWPIASRLASRTIHLPCHPGLSDRDVELVCQTMLLMMKQNTFSRGD